MQRPWNHLPDSASSIVVAAAGTIGTAGTVGDPEGTRTITSIVALLVAIGLALLMIAIWLYRATRPDPDLLAPLEMMGERKWRRSDPVWQRRRLDALRPEGAEPLEPASAPPDIDEAFDRGPTASGFDDLHDDVGDPASVPGSDGDLRDEPVPGELPPPAGPRMSSEPPTPQQIVRPTLDDLPDHEVDPELLAAAMAELDAELSHDSDVTAD